MTEPQKDAVREAAVIWKQQDLIPPDVFDITIRIGVVGSANHLQVQVEEREPGRGALRSMFSLPHRPLSDMRAVLAVVCDEIVEWTSPF